jgi:glycosyltransferase involved in cell wall biosynthesis
MAQRVQILLLIPRLGGGGAQKVMALLAGGLSREKYAVHLALVTQADVAASSLPPWVTVHALGARRVRAGAFALLRLVWRLRPGVILSGAPEVSFLVLLLRPLFPPKTSVLVRQNTTVSAALASGGLPRYTRWLYRLLYRHADRVICQSRAMAEDLARELGIDEEQIAVLPNPVDLERIRRAEDKPYAWSGAGPHLLAVGRLAPEKGLDLLLEALVNVRGQFPNADLIIVGEGREEKALKSLCRSLGLEAAVRFAGQVDCPYTFFPGATLFVLSSRYEGMPNALLEAAAAGLPLVAMPASGGIVDLLRGQPGAWLAPEVSADALSASIHAALIALRPGQRFHHQFSSSGEETNPTPIPLAASNLGSAES